jgi:hypothetical protein
VLASPILVENFLTVPQLFLQLGAIGGLVTGPKPMVPEMKKNAVVVSRRPRLPKEYKDHPVKEPSGAECIREETKRALDLLPGSSPRGSLSEIRCQ